MLDQKPSEKGTRRLARYEIKVLEKKGHRTAGKIVCCRREVHWQKTSGEKLTRGREFARRRIR